MSIAVKNDNKTLLLRDEIKSLLKKQNSSYHCYLCDLYFSYKPTDKHFGKHFTLKNNIQCLELLVKEMNNKKLTLLYNKIKKLEDETNDIIKTYFN